MSDSITVQFLLIFLLILLNGFFALAEFSIIASRKSKLRQKVRQGKKGAARAEKLHSQPERFLATVQVGITLVATLAGVVGGATLVTKLENYLGSVSVAFITQMSSGLAIALVAISITVISVVLGELVPKYVALSFPERWARLVSRPIGIFVAMTSIFSRALGGMAGLLVRLAGVRRPSERPAITEEEINLMILDGKEKGVFDETEEKLIKSVFDFADSTVRRAMTPRTDVIGIDISTKPAEVMEKIAESLHTRYPVYRGSLDNVVGVLHTKDIIAQRLNPKLIILNDLIRRVPFVPDSMPLSKLLRDFQRRRHHFAIVLDEFGGTAGIVTLEDILEELVGEIQGEDEREPLPVVKHSENVAFVSGSAWPGAINEEMDTHLPEDKAETVAGLVINHLGRLPQRDEVVHIADTSIRILELQDNRLLRLKLEKINRD